MSAWVGPVQNQTVMVVGGGGIGESRAATRRIDIVKVNDRAPRFRAGPDLPAGTRYPNLVQLPDDTTLITNGSGDYRGRGASDHHTARLYHPATNALTVAADPRVGRNYHSAAVLLPDGRVLTVGSDPLFRDAKNSISGTFEQRMEVYSPPYLFRGARPVITSAPAVLRYGRRVKVATPSARDVVRARLIRPSAATHMLNLDQRSVALPIKRIPGGVAVTVPRSAALVPPGPYLLFLVDRAGVPSSGHWVRVR
jgi:hypothetical protein